MARTRQRRASRRASEASRRQGEPLETRSTPGRAARSVARTSGARATGAPSPSLEKAALAERIYVTKDFRRIAVTLVAMLILLALAGIAETSLFR